MPAAACWEQQQRDDENKEGCNDPSFQRVFVYNRRLVLKSASRLVDTLLLLFSGQYLYDHLY